MALVTTPFTDGFDRFNHNEWTPATHAGNGWWQYNGFSSSNVQSVNGKLRLELNTDDMGQKAFTGAEIQSDNTFGYGRYETTMKSSGETGVISTFFTYTGPSYGTTWNEVDFELIGKDRNFVHIAYHNGKTSYTRDIPVSFDHSEAFHTYAFEWEPGAIRWYVDGKLLHAVQSATVPSTPSHLFLNIWTGLEGWLGKATFAGETQVLYDHVSFQPYVPGKGYTSTPTTPAPAPAPTPAPPPAAVNVDLYDAVRDVRLERLTDGERVPASELGSGELTLVVQPRGTTASFVKSVTIALDGPGNADWSRTESAAPYALFGDSRGLDFAGRMFPEGEYTATITTWSARAGGGRVLGRETLDFTLGNAQSAAVEPTELEFRLYELSTGKTLRMLEDGDRIDLARLTSGRVNIEAMLADDADVESMLFVLDGPFDHRNTENVADYTLFSRQNAPSAGALPDGAYRLSVDAYEADSGGGRQLASADLDFVFI